MKLGFNNQEGVDWAKGSGYIPQKEEDSKVTNEQKNTITTHIVNRDGSIICALYPEDPYYEVQAMVRKHGLESFTIKTLNDPAKIIHHGHLVKIYSANTLLGIAIIDELQVESKFLTIKGSGLLKLIYNFKMPEIHSSLTSHKLVKDIIQLIFDTAHQVVSKEYPLLIPVDIINVPSEIFPSFSIVKDSKVGDLLEAIADLLGGAYYGVDNICALFFSTTTVSKRVYLHYEKLLNCDVKLDIGSVRNKVRVIVSDQATGEVINDLDTTPYAQHVTSQAKYGIRSADIDMWFLATSQESTLSLAQKLLVPEAQWSGKMTSQNFIDLFAPLSISGLTAEPQREVILALKDLKEITYTPTLITTFQRDRYILGHGAYTFIGQGNITIKITRINMQYIIINGAGSGTITVKSYYAKEVSEYTLSMANTPNHTSDYRMDVMSCDYLELFLDGTITIDHIACVRRVQDIFAVPESYDIKVKGRSITMDIGVGRAKDHQKIFKSLGKQAQLQHQYLLRNTSKSNNKAFASAMLTQRLAEEIYLSSSPTTIHMPNSAVSLQARLNFSNNICQMHGVLGVYIPTTQPQQVIIDNTLLKPTHYTPIQGEYRIHKSAPVIGFLELPKIYDQKQLTVTYQSHDALWISHDDIEREISKKTVRTYLNNHTNLTHPLTITDLSQSLLKVNNQVVLPHAKSFMPSRYHIPTKRWRPKLLDESIYIEPLFSKLYAHYSEYLGVVLNESVSEIVEVVINGKVQKPVLKVSDLKRYANGYYLVPAGEDLESLLLLSDEQAKQVVRVSYYGTGSVLSIIDINQGYKPTWSELPYEQQWEGSDDWAFDLPSYATHYAVYYEHVDQPITTINRIGATSGSQGSSGNSEGGKGGTGGKGAMGGNSTREVHIIINEFTLINVGSVAGYGGIGGGGGGGGGGGSGNGNGGSSGSGGSGGSAGSSGYDGSSGYVSSSGSSGSNSSSGPSNGGKGGTAGATGLRGNGNSFIHTIIQTPVIEKIKTPCQTLRFVTSTKVNAGLAGGNGNSGGSGGGASHPSGGGGGRGGNGGQGGYGSPLQVPDGLRNIFSQDNNNPFGVASNSRYRKITIRWI